MLAFIGIAVNELVAHTHGRINDTFGLLVKAMKLCNNCLQINRDDHKFCVGCGQPTNSCAIRTVEDVEVAYLDRNYVYQTEFEPFYHVMISRGVRRLPEEIDFELLHAWCAENRGECFRARDAEHFQQCLAAFYGRLKEDFESLARKLGSAEFDRDFDQVAIWFLLSSKQLNLQSAIDQILKRLSRGETQFANSNDIEKAVRTFRQDLYAWLDRKGIFYSKKPSITIPSTTITRLLGGFAGRPDVHFAPNIPVDKLDNAVRACGLPDSEQVSVLIDCTFFGSAADSVLVGSRAIYFNNSGVNGYPLLEEAVKAAKFRQVQLQGKSNGIVIENLKTKDAGRLTIDIAAAAYLATEQLH
jgi:hypothetical protein